MAEHVPSDEPPRPNEAIFELARALARIAAREDAAKRPQPDGRTDPPAAQEPEL